MIPEIGLEGQAPLRQARVLIAVAAGLGSAVGMYLVSIRKCYSRHGGIDSPRRVAGFWTGQVEQSEIPSPGA